MIYLKLFLTFLEIGAVSFGGGYAMIALIRERMLANGWLSEDALLNMIAIAESTPGPIAVNMATFTGASVGGVLGALVATLGIVLPSFLIILLIAAVIKEFLKYKGVKAFVGGIRPCTVGLIIATALTMLLSVLFGFRKVGGGADVDIRAIIIFGLIVAVALISKYVLKKKTSPIFMILLSAVLGIALYSL